MIKKSDLTLRIENQYRISPTIIKVFTERFDPTKGYLYLKPSDSKSMYRIAYALHDAGYVTRSKEASKIYVIFNTNDKFTTLRNITLSMSRELKKLSTLI